MTRAGRAYGDEPGFSDQGSAGSRVSPTQGKRHLYSLVHLLLSHDCYNSLALDVYKKESRIISYRHSILIEIIIEMTVVDI